MLDNKKDYDKNKDTNVNGKNTNSILDGSFTRGHVSNGINIDDIIKTMMNNNSNNSGGNIKDNNNNIDNDMNSSGDNIKDNNNNNNNGMNNSNVNSNASNNKNNNNGPNTSSNSNSINRSDILNLAINLQLERIETQIKYEKKRNRTFQSVNESFDRLIELLKLLN
ncbi:MAG: hypothetical protein ACRC1M_06825 [Methanobacteriaceae archaeon]